MEQVICQYRIGKVIQEEKILWQTPLGVVLSWLKIEISVLGGNNVR